MTAVRIPLSLSLSTCSPLSPATPLSLSRSPARARPTAGRADHISPAFAGRAPADRLRDRAMGSTGGFPESRRGPGGRGGAAKPQHAIANAGPKRPRRRRPRTGGGARRGPPPSGHHAPPRNRVTTCSSPGKVARPPLVSPCNRPAVGRFAGTRLPQLQPSALVVLDSPRRLR